MSRVVIFQAPKPVAKAAKAAPVKPVAKKAPVESSDEESSDAEVFYFLFEHGQSPCLF